MSNEATEILSDTEVLRRRDKDAFDSGFKAGMEYSKAQYDALAAMLYCAVRELEYVQLVENCTSGLCASAEGRKIIEDGMKVLGIADLSGDTLETTKMLPRERP